MRVERGEECSRTGEESFLERFENELGRQFLGVVLGSLNAQFCILPQRRMNVPFFVGVANLDRFEHTFRKPGRSIVLLGQFRLHTSDHDRIELLAVGRCTASEPLVVEQFEQCGKTFRVAVVRRGRQKQLVFKMRHEQAKGVRAHRVGGITAHTRGSAVVGFIEDQQIELAREGGFVWTG